MIYDGTSAHANGESSTDRQIGESAYNSGYDDNAYVGYMYGTENADTYAATHANTNNSTIKTVVDNWYKTNIVDAGYSGSVVDAIYCNDRVVSSTASYNGNGSANTVTRYIAAKRIAQGKAPILTFTCTQVNDRFTVAESIGKISGNIKLTYPVGLITADEVAMAGGVDSATNNLFYLYTGNRQWTMTPHSFDGDLAYLYYIRYDGYFQCERSNGSVGVFSGVRPVISISPNAITSGTGTSTDPFLAS